MLKAGQPVLKTDIFFVYWNSGMFLCFRCAADRFSAISSCLITEGLLDECKLVFCVSSPSPVLGEDAVAQNICPGSAAIPRAAAKYPHNRGQIPLPLWGSGLRQHIWPAAMGANVLKLLEYRAKGELGAFSLTPLKPLLSQRYLKVLRQVKRQWQSLVFSYWNVRGEGLGLEEPTWPHSCANRFTDLYNVPCCALAFPWLSRISVVPATPLLNAEQGPALC